MLRERRHQPGLLPCDEGRQHEQLQEQPSANSNVQEKEQASKVKKTVGRIPDGTSMCPLLLLHPVRWQVKGLS